MEIQFVEGRDARLFAGTGASVYLVHGEEDTLKARVERAVVERYIDADYSEFDMEVLTAESSTADSILSSVGQASFASPRRVVVVRGMEQWRERGRHTEADALASKLGGIGSNACLILLVAAQEDEAKRKTIITPKLDSAVRELGAVVTCKALKDEPLREWIREQFQQYEKRIDGDAIDRLVQSVGNEMRLLHSEIDKLVSYVGDRIPINVADVTTVVAHQAEDVMFQCVDAVSRRQTDRAMMLLHELHLHDHRPQAVAGRLISLLSRQYRLIWQAKYLASESVAPRDLRMLPARITAELPSDSSILQVSYKLAELFSLAQKYSYSTLHSIFDLLMLCDMANKGGVLEDSSAFGVDPVANLQLLILQLTSADSSSRVHAVAT